MAAGDVIGRIYSGASSLGRDVFHYIVTGTLFVVLCSIPFEERCGGLWSSLLGAVQNPGLQIVLLFVAAIVGCLWCQDLLPLSFGVGVAALGSGMLLMRQHLVTNTSFLNRVLAAYQIVQQEAKGPATQP